VQAGETNPLTETWRAGKQPQRRRRRRRRGWLRNLISSLVTIAIVGGVLLWLLLRNQGELQVTALTVRAPQATQRCDTTVEVTGVATTNGKRGQISYRWLQSDGHESGVLQTNVERGKRKVSLPLRWAITGPGKLHAVATLELLSPGETSRKASAAFDYHCG
jgi:hypothetical protein